MEQMRPRTKDLTGQQFGRLKVLSLSSYGGRYDSRPYESQWLCECLCKTKKVVAGTNLKRGNVKSCGCLSREQAVITGMSRRKDLTGRTYGRWKVLGLYGRNKHNNIMYLCECQCSKGTIKPVLAGQFVNGYSRSCGRLWYERMKTHGLAGSKVYNIWAGLRYRIPKLKQQLCPEWESFETFLADVGLPPTEEHKLYCTVKGMYLPGNMVWKLPRSAADRIIRQRETSRKKWHKDKLEKSTLKEALKLATNALNKARLRHESLISMMKEVSNGTVSKKVTEIKRTPKRKRVAA